MKSILRIEYAALTVLGFAAFAQLDLSWWWFAALILAPDVSMVGYLFGSKTGARLYNSFHNFALAVAIGVVGWSLGIVAIECAGIILFTHASLDRVLGYGLKYPDHFRHTHLGWIGGTHVERDSDSATLDYSERR